MNVCVIDLSEVLFIIKNQQNSKMAALPNSHQLLKSTPILNLFIK